MKYPLYIVFFIFWSCNYSHHNDHPSSMHGHHDSTHLNLLLKPANQYVLSKVKTVQLVQKEIPAEFFAQGVITYDRKLVNAVSARVSGRIDKLYARSRYQHISRGERLMDIYSKDLVTEQENYLFLLKNDPTNAGLISAGEKRLKFSGVGQEQIDELKRSMKVESAVTVFSPYNGHLHDIDPAEITMTGMDNPLNISEAGLYVKEGMYVEKGQTVFNIISTEKVWAIISFYPEHKPLMMEGSKVLLTVDGIPDTIEEEIEFIEPFLRNDQRVGSARIYLDNSKGEYKIGAIVKAKIISGNFKGLFLPDEAVLNLGNSKVVFVERDGMFEVRRVYTGHRLNGLTEIVSGLDTTEEAAINAQLLMDSESFVRRIEK